LKKEVGPGGKRTAFRQALDACAIASEIAALREEVEAFSVAFTPISFDCADMVYL